MSDKVRLQMRGNADKLLPLCIPGTTRSQVDEILHPPGSFPVTAEDILADLAKLMGIDKVRAGLGFADFNEAVSKMPDDAPEFTPIGEGAIKKEKPPI